MKLTFLESPLFTKQLHWVADDDTLLGLQNELMREPDKGAVIRGSGGLRKVRVKLPGRGKSAGARVICLHLPEVETVVLFMLYTKSKKSDLTESEKGELRLAVDKIKKEMLK